METNNKMTGIIAKAAAEKAVTETRKQPQTLKDYVRVMEGQFARALPKVMTPERFTRIALSALSNTPKLMECTRNSFLGALMNAAQLGLEPNTPLGQAYLIPYENRKKGVTECQFQIGYKGLLDLCYRSGEVASVQAQVVYENDKFEYELGLDPKLVHIPAIENRGAAKFVYAVCKLKNGGYAFEVMSMDDVRRHAEKYSQAYKSGPWQTNFEEMAKKTVLKRVLKYAPIRSDFVTADNTVSAFDEKAGEVTADYVMTDDGNVVDTETGEVVAENADTDK